MSVAVHFRIWTCNLPLFLLLLGIPNELCNYSDRNNLPQRSDKLKGNLFVVLWENRVFSFFNSKLDASEVGTLRQKAASANNFWCINFFVSFLHACIHLIFCVPFTLNIGIYYSSPFFTWRSQWIHLHNSPWVFILYE